MNLLRRNDLVYPELSYQLVGILFKVHNELGHQLLERYYQSAIAHYLKESGMKFKEQVQIKLKLESVEVAKGYLDFVVEEKIILEIKKADRFLKQNIDQVNSYLQITGLKLAIIANFTARGLQFKRLVNTQENQTHPHHS